MKQTYIDLSFIAQQPVIAVQEFTAEKRWIEKTLKRRLALGDRFPLRVTIPVSRKRLYEGTVKSIRTDTNTGKAYVTISLAFDCKKRKAKEGKWKTMTGPGSSSGLSSS